MIINEEEINNLSGITLPTKTLIRKFGRPEDNAELYIRDLNGNLLQSIPEFRGFKPPDQQTGTDGLYNEINIDYTETLKNLGYTSGQYIMEIGFYRRIVLNSNIKPFYISEISPSGTEIKIKSDIISDNEVIVSFNELIGIMTSTAYFREILFKFENGVSSTAINLNIDSISEPTEVLAKLYTPLPQGISVGSKFSIEEEIINPISITVDLG